VITRRDSFVWDQNGQFLYCSWSELKQAIQQTPGGLGIAAADFGEMLEYRSAPFREKTWALRNEYTRLVADAKGEDDIHLLGQICSALMLEGRALEAAWAIVRLRGENDELDSHRAAHVLNALYAINPQHAARLIQLELKGFAESYTPEIRALDVIQASGELRPEILRFMETPVVEDFTKRRDDSSERSVDLEEDALSNNVPAWINDGSHAITPILSNGHTPASYHKLLRVFEQVQSASQYLIQAWDPTDPLSLVNFVRVEDPHLRDDLHAIRTRLRKGFADLVSEGKYVLLCEMVYDVVQRHDWLYDFEPGFPDYTRQRIRTPREIHADRVGTCLDFACLFAAMLECMQADPVIVRLCAPGVAHALAGCWVKNRPMQPCIRDQARVQQAVRRDDLLLFETTGAGRASQSVAGEKRNEQGVCDFQEAKRAARELILDDTIRFDFLLDVLAAR
jgi:hypothetical protein